MGELSFFLGLQIKQSKEGIFLCQSKYCNDFLKKFDMESCKTATTPMSTNCYLSANEARTAVDQTKYRGLIGFLLYLTARYSDSDFARCKWDRKSTSGTCHLLGSSLISWHSKKLACVALSTAEAEYIATRSCCAQILWIKQQMEDFGLKVNKFPLFSDNTS
ncbi:uncharacterized mitochondrial protein AtMg00810-like [Phaseolus vulgaris]|uniref:uncharacterized mitochondrial protein AtMg00810-like n=1 Tax=Phaseolus vulgaris TaxID=3885 RepID=UPI0035CAA457